MKRKIIIILVALLVLTTGCINKSIDNSNTYVNDSGQNNQEDNVDSQVASIEEIMSKLASDEFQGRLTGTEGNKKAIEFMTGRFEEIGLDKLEDDNYFHTYEQEIFNPDKSQHSLIVEFKDGSTKEYVYGTDYMEQTRIKEVDLKAEMDIFDSGEDISINDEDISNKIIVTDRDDYYNVGKNSKAILIKKDVYFGNAMLSNRPSPMIQITNEVFEELRTRDVTSIEIKLKNHVEIAEVKNVVGKISGKDSTKALVLSAHFDHVGWAGETVFNGAVDNASGTTVILDLARRLKERSKQNPFNMDIIIVAFNGEEAFLKGSEAFVGYINDKYDYIYNINIDCVGKKDGGDIALDDQNPINHELIETMKESLVKNDIGFKEKAYGTSDHVSFNGYNLSGITIGQEGLLGKEAEIRIHTPEDNLSIIDFNYIEKISDSIFDFVITNDGKVFESTETSGTTKASGGAYNKDEMDKIFDKLFEIKKERNLQYDEKLILEIDGYQCVITGDGPLKDIQLVKKYYPNLNIDKEINGYEFTDASINTEGGGMMVVGKGIEEFSKDEIDKISKRELSEDTIRRIRLNYSKDNESIVYNVDLYSNFSRNYQPYVFEHCDTEEIDVDGSRYFIIKNKETEGIRGILRELHLNNKTYYVQVDKYEVHNEEPDGVESLSTNQRDRSKNTKEAMIQLIKELDLENWISNLGI